MEYQTSVLTQLVNRAISKSEVEMEIREMRVEKSFPVDTYPDVSNLELLEVRERAQNLLKTTHAKRRAEPRLAKRRKKDRKAEVNDKRQRVADIYRTSPANTIFEVASLAQVSYLTAKKVIDHLRLAGTVQEYQYNNLHSRSNLEKLEKTIDDPARVYQSVKDIKRIHPTFSKKAIRKTLHSKGKRYTRIKPVTKSKKKVNMDWEKLRVIMATVLEGIEHKDKRILFCDEIKFSLSRTTSHVWLDRSKLKEGDTMELSTRPESVMLVVMVVCSCQGFVSFQVCLEDIKAVDFLYFLQSTVSTLEPICKYRVLADNPQWHKGAVIAGSKANEFLLFNIPGLFQLNLIENSFSALRAAFERRPQTESVAEDIAYLSHLMFTEENKTKFEGYTRNMLRTIIRLADKYERET